MGKTKRNNPEIKSQNTKQIKGVKRRRLLPTRRFFLLTFALVSVLSIGGFLKTQFKTKTTNDSAVSNLNEPDFLRETLADEIQVEGREDSALLLDYMFRAENLIAAGNSSDAVIAAIEAEKYSANASFDDLLRLSQVFSKLGNQEKASEYLLLASESIYAVDDVSVQLQAYDFFRNAGLSDQSQKHYEKAQMLDSKAVADYEANKNSNQTVDDGPN